VPPQAITKSRCNRLPRSVCCQGGAFIRPRPEGAVHHGWPAAADCQLPRLMQAGPSLPTWFWLTANSDRGHRDGKLPVHSQEAVRKASPGWRGGPSAPCPKQSEYPCGRKSISPSIAVRVSSGADPSLFPASAVPAAQPKEAPSTLQHGEGERTNLAVINPKIATSVTPGLSPRGYALAFPQEPSWRAKLAVINPTMPPSIPKAIAPPSCGLASSQGRREAVRRFLTLCCRIARLIQQAAAFDTFLLKVRPLSPSATCPSGP
jgi:hypothetical protein